MSWMAAGLTALLVNPVMVAAQDEDPEDMDENDANMEDLVDEEDEGDEEEEEEEPPAPAKSKKKKSKGTMTVEMAGEETAKVFVDGIEVGETDWEDDILPGTYKVKVKTPGLPGWKGKVPVKKGKETVVTVDLEGKKMGPSTSPMFWSCLGAAVPSLAMGIAFAAMSKASNDEAKVLARRLDVGVWAADPILEAEKAQKQHDLVDNSRQQEKTSIAMFVVTGVLTAATVVSPFIFKKEKRAARAHIEVSSVAPVVDPQSGTVGVGVGGTF